MKIHFNIIVLSTPRSSTKTLHPPVLPPIRATFPAHLVPVLITPIIQQHSQRLFSVARSDENKHDVSVTSAYFLVENH